LLQKPIPKSEGEFESILGSIPESGLGRKSACSGGKPAGRQAGAERRGAPEEEKQREIASIGQCIALIG